MKRQLSLNDLQDALSFVDPNCSYDEWIRVLFAVKSEFGDSARSIAENWSKNGDSFSALSFQNTWKSFKPDKGITIATLIHVAKQNGWKHQKTQSIDSRQPSLSNSKINNVIEAKHQNSNQRLISQKASEIINLSKPAPMDHPYLSKKKILPHGILYGSTNKAFKTLIIPVYGSLPPFSEIIQSIQTINDKGQKFFLAGGRKVGGYFPIQWIENAPIIICEGFATGASIAEHFAPTSSVICAFDAGNLTSVAKAFRKKNPKHKIIIAGDNDRFTKEGWPSKKNIGVEKAKMASKAVDGFISIPQFEEHEIGSDWNDRYLLDTNKEPSL